MKTMQSTAAKAAPSDNIKKNAIRVLIVDDHPLLRKGVGQLIDQEKDLAVVGEAEDAQKAITAIETTKPDVALIDITLNGSSGIELLKNIKARFPKIKMLVLSMHDEAVYANRALKAGARGYVSKRETSEKVIQAIRRVLSGGMYISEALAQAIREAGHKNVHYFHSMQDGIVFLLKQARPGDAILTIGAGSVSRASGELMVLLGTEHPTTHAH